MLEALKLWVLTFPSPRFTEAWYSKRSVASDTSLVVLLTAGAGTPLSDRTGGSWAIDTSEFERQCRLRPSEILLVSGIGSVTIDLEPADFGFGFR